MQVTRYIEGFYRCVHHGFIYYFSERGKYERRKQKGLDDSVSDKKESFINTPKLKRV
jgi:hypothetical protein